MDKKFDLESNIPAQGDVNGNNNMLQQEENAIEQNYNTTENDAVVINDNSPVIILFGAGSSGKTMTLIRLSKYLMDIGFRIEPVRTFRDSRDTHYQAMCDNFTSLINSGKAPGRNLVIDYMLVKVINPSGRPVCQLLEAPGEHYFDTKNPTKDSFPTYLQTIKEHNSRKTWMFIIEKDWIPEVKAEQYNDQQIRALYAKKIKELQDNYVLIEDGDKVIFTLHKADKHLISGQLNVKQLFADVKNQYPSIFDNYKEKRPIIKWFKEYIFDFVPFSAGSFPDDGNGGQHYIKGKDKYPAELWQAILKTVRGGW